jgi:hypothetical protein
VTTPRIVLIVAVTLGVAASGSAQEKGGKKKQPKPAVATTLPSDPPPTFMLVTEVDAEARQLTLHYRVSIPVIETREVEVEIDGMKVRQTQTFTVLRAEDRRTVMLLDGIVAAAGGKPLKTDDEWKALRGRIIVVAHPGGKLDPAYAKLLSKDTVTIEHKPAEGAPAKLEP